MNHTHGEMGSFNKTCTRLYRKHFRAAFIYLESREPRGASRHVWVSHPISHIVGLQHSQPKSAMNRKLVTNFWLLVNFKFQVRVFSNFCSSDVYIVALVYPMGGTPTGCFFSFLFLLNFSSQFANNVVALSTIFCHRRSRRWKHQR
jgi:hypothetical protein